MKIQTVKSVALLLGGFCIGLFVTHFQVASASGNTGTEPSRKHFLVSIDEVQQNFVFAEDFSGHYTKSVTLSDGTTRNIELTPMIYQGMQVVEFNDSGFRTYMGLNGATTNGKLMVQLRDVDTMHALLEAEGVHEDGR